MLLEEFCVHLVSRFDRPVVTIAHLLAGFECLFWFVFRFALCRIVLRASLHRVMSLPNFENGGNDLLEIGLTFAYLLDSFLDELVLFLRLLGLFLLLLGRFE